VLAPAERAGGGAVEAVSLPEDESVAETPGGLDAEPLRRGAERAGHVDEMIGHLLLRDPDEAREFPGGARAIAELAEEGLADGDRALCRWALTSLRGHVPRVLHLGSIGG